MSLYGRYILPGLIDWACSQPAGMKQRENLIPGAKGRVLEVGIGSGMNLPFYSADRVDFLAGIDPFEKLWERKRTDLLSLGFKVEYLPGSAESIPFPDECFDTVVSTHTLCSIVDIELAVAEIFRILKPGGRLIYSEHGIAPDRKLARRQQRINPLWKRISGGCNLDRDIAGLISAAGFIMGGAEEGYLDSWRPTSYQYWGWAGKSKD